MFGRIFTHVLVILAHVICQHCNITHWEAKSKSMNRGEEKKMKRKFPWSYRRPLSSRVLPLIGLQEAHVHCRMTSDGSTLELQLLPAWSRRRGKGAVNSVDAKCPKLYRIFTRIYLSPADDIPGSKVSHGWENNSFSFSFILLELRRVREGPWKWEKARWGKLCDWITNSREGPGKENYLWHVYPTAQQQWTGHA